jgi:mono/diheme cytochrome c family protein
MRLAFVVTIGACLILTACSKEKKPDAVPDSEPGKTAEVSLAGDLMPVFAKSCAGCHKREGGIAAAIEGGVFIEKKEDILKAIGTGIVPGKPAESGFLKVLDQTYPVGRDKVVMPPPNSKAPKWSKEDLDLFSRWIAEGAKDN